MEKNPEKKRQPFNRGKTIRHKQPVMVSGIEILAARTIFEIKFEPQPGTMYNYSSEDRL